MLTYTGFIQCDPPLTQQEVDFFNQWQNLLNEVYLVGEESYYRIDQFLGLELNKNQRWTIGTWCYSPHISWTQEGMIVEGSYEKGRFRDALLAYQYFFFGDEPVLKNAKYDWLHFIQSHQLNGVIDSYKDEYKVKSGNHIHSHWLYVVENSDVTSVKNCSLENFLANPSLYPKEGKEDTCWDKLNRYFPPLYRYAKIVKAVYEEQKDVIDVPKNKL